MNQIPLYQHPYVDVFKLTKLTDWLTTQKEGDVQDQVWDANLAKNYVRIQGPSSSSNYIQVPATKHLPKKALGLTGKYIYLLLSKPDGKNFTIHVDYMVNSSRNTKISMSNIYKNFKNLNGSSLQIPLNLQADKWTVVCINVGDVLEQNNVFLANQDPTFFLRSFQICSTINVRGVFTSDIQYQATTLPKDMQLKIPKDSDWFQLYNWFQYPGSQTAEFAPNDELGQIIQKQDQKENKSNNSKEQKLKPPTNIKKEVGLKKPASAAKPKDKASSQLVKPSAQRRLSGVKSTVKFDPQESVVEAGEAVGTTEASTKAPGGARHIVDEEEQLMYQTQIQTTAKEIEALKENYNYNIQAKNLTETAQITLYQDNDLYDPKMDPRNKNKKNDKFILRPNPIMRLDRVVGWHPNYTSGQIFFNPDKKLSKEILYSQANLLLGFYPPLQKQRLFYERHTNTIDQLFVCRGNNESNFGFSICKSLEEKSKDNELTIWSLDSLETTNASSQSLFTFKPPLKSIHSISISCDQDMEYLCLAGKDHQLKDGRDIIIVYKFQDLIKMKKTDIVARQISDFETFNVRFNTVIQNSIISCGKENIKLYKIKNGHLPGQSVILNNTGRGKVFNRAVVQESISQSQKTKKANFIFVTTDDGLLYFVNYHTRQVDKIIQIHEGQIQGLVAAPNNEFYLTASASGIIRIWTNDFENLKSEVNTGNQITDCDVSCDSTQICVLSANMGTISVLDLESSSYNVCLRSHMDNITDLDYNQMTGKLITVGDDYCVKVWHAENMEQVNEFVSENDLPIRVVSQNQGIMGEGVTTEDSDTLVAIGFKSGFLRILDLNQMKIVHETLLFQSPVMDIEFSLDNKFMAVFFKCGKIVIINKDRPGQFQPVKNIDFELPNQNYCSLSFSKDGSMLANISSNANTITVWETRNFSLRYSLDVTGDIISKIQFAPNEKDLVLLTTSSKLKFYRLGSSMRDTELIHIKDSYGITDMECTDFQITSNNRFIICAGKEGVVKVYDYFMRGEVIPSTQAFMGHFKSPKRVIAAKDLRNVYSIGELNGIYKWTFYGDASIPEDMSTHYEQLENEKQTRKSISGEPNQQQISGQELFDQDELAAYTQQQIDNLQSGHQNQGMNAAPQMSNGEQTQVGRSEGGKFLHTVDLNKGGYIYEKFELKLSKILACSNGPQVRNNLVWNEAQKYVAYSMQNIIVIESLNQEKTQRLLKEGNDQIYQIKMSPSMRYLLVYSKTGPVDGFPCIYIFDAITFNKLNQIAISDAQIDSVEFSGYSNMLLVVSSSKQGEGNINTTVSVWDFIDGHKDIFCKSMLPIPVKAACWNPYVEGSGDEFCTISDRCYHYWRITENLQLQYQEGELPKKETEGFRDKTDMFTSLTFVQPDYLHHSVYMMLGLLSGYVWVTDTRTNQYLYNVKVLGNDDGGVQRIFSSHSRIVIEPANSSVFHCWDQSGKNGDKEFTPSNPYNLFMGMEFTLQIDGNITSSSYDKTGNQMIALSTTGSFWYLSWTENATFRLKSCHNPNKSICCADYKYVSPSEFTIKQEQDQQYTFDQNYQISTASSDGQMKLWNMHDLEYSQQFIVPKEECIYIAMHQFKPYMVCSFTDGYLRFFDLGTSKLLGRCQIHSATEQNTTGDKSDEEAEGMIDYVISLKILPSGNHILAATKNGQIVLIFVNSWLPLAIKIVSLVSINTSVNSFDFSYLEPYNKWLVATANGKVVVYNRKDFNSLNQEIFDESKPPVFNYMDSFNLLDYVSNGFAQTKRCNTLDHYYSMAKRNLVYNEVDQLHECEGVFTNNDLTLHLSWIRQCNYLFIRNFELHQVVKRIEMSSSSMPRSMQLMPGNTPFVCVALQDNSIKLIDFMNEANQSRIETMHEELKCMKVCPNGRYILTGGTKGDISLWAINKSILSPEETIKDAIKL